MATDELNQRIQQRFPDRGITVEPFEGLAGRVLFPPAAALELFRFLRDDRSFHHLSFVAGVDWKSEREVVYALWSDTERDYLLLSTRVDASDPHLESATSVWPSANWHEREAWEMVGIRFDHHPDLRHLLMPDGYEFHPLLRSFKLHEPEELEVKVRHV
ncbi:MAG: NADH-quinone oxidoreductase subunit C [Thermoplasmata archaeon]|nr:NADH-quinone oxidoreductase subunit C [Thermoplasmata archaeon]MCI4358999.1 NADH-quinone oxidoreductase subunit C [Thermoplasmata archaeon]